YFEDVFQPQDDRGWQASVDALFLFRTDDMSSVLMQNAAIGSPAFQTGDLDLGTMVGPMVNVIKDSDNGWGVGFRYFSLRDGYGSAGRLADPGQTFQEHFNGLDWPDLIQVDTTYTSELHNVELNLRKRVLPDVVVFAGYRFLELDETFSIRARNGLPQEPA